MSILFGLGLPPPPPPGLLIASLGILGICIEGSPGSLRPFPFKSKNRGNPGGTSSVGKVVWVVVALNGIYGECRTFPWGVGLCSYHFKNRSHSFGLKAVAQRFKGISTYTSFRLMGKLYGFQKANDGYIARANLLSAVQFGRVENLNSTNVGTREWFVGSGRMVGSKNRFI